ncbi:UNVERIFIED_CONTAM: hypothetical protein Slati_0401500 [Sesamum latifolium]|uniref:Uncharacterized protein n=1 Tax=Sesamum latifolium TaxID=2727402 RepID=A0AAW2XUV2_9LAMI
MKKERSEEWGEAVAASRCSEEQRRMYGGCITSRTADCERSRGGRRGCTGNRGATSENG